MSDSVLFTGYPGDTLTLGFSVTDTQGVPVDISAWTLEVSMDRNPYTTSDNAAYGHNPLVISPEDAAAGQFNFTVDAATTAALGEGVYYLTIERVFNGVRTTVMNGTVNFVSLATPTGKLVDHTLQVQIDQPEGVFILDSKALSPETQAYLEEIRDLANADRIAAETAATASSDSATASEASATASAGSATDSATSADEALASQQLAATHETNAGDYSDAALVSEQAALASEQKAKDWSEELVDVEVEPGLFSSKHHATKSGDSATAAAASESNAATSETNASASAVDSANSATASATSETNAANSATASATSATEADTSATNAADAETGALAAQSATESLLDQFGDQYLGSKTEDPTTDNDGNALVDGAVYWNTTDDVLKFYSGTAWVAPEDVASTAATNAQASADAAAVSEQNASTSETNAANSATASQTSADAASASETAAATSESNASTSETNAAGSASAAATSETNAAASADSAATSEANIETTVGDAITAHEGEADPHPGYDLSQEVTNKAVSNAITFAIALG